MDCHCDSWTAIYASPENRAYGAGNEPEERESLDGGQERDQQKRQQLGITAGLHSIKFVRDAGGRGFYQCPQSVMFKILAGFGKHLLGDKRNMKDSRSRRLRSRLSPEEH